MKRERERKEKGMKKRRKKELERRIFKHQTVTCFQLILFSCLKEEFLRDELREKRERGKKRERKKENPLKRTPFGTSFFHQPTHSQSFLAHIKKERTFLFDSYLFL